VDGGEEHLFRREAGRLVARLTRLFGVHNLALAEDVAQDALCRALEVWKLRGMPDDPSAWLLATARNRALDVLRRERTARTFAPELAAELASEWTLVATVHEVMQGQGIADDELRMMFTCCHPRLPEEAQVALVLHVLCGFGVGEVAAAFFSTEAAMEKRIGRAKKVLAASKRLFAIDGTGELLARLPAVQRALYLLFNEGYHGASSSSAVREELCREAMRLAEILAEHPVTATPATQALLALMCLHAARLPGRLDADGHLRALADQDRSLWDGRLVAEGLRWLDASARGDELSEYHLEAAIATVHARAPTARETPWDEIVALYDRLLALRPSPVVALGRAIAVAEHEGPGRGLEEVAAIPGRERLEEYPFYAATLGELELRLGRRAAAGAHFRRAADLARSEMERVFFERRVAACAGS
jgi:RNA polymerase sigma-70 factor (ECF subfamily)